MQKKTLNETIITKTLNIQVEKCYKKKTNHLMGKCSKQLNKKWKNAHK